MNALSRIFSNRIKRLPAAVLLSLSLAGSPQTASADTFSPAMTATMYSMMSAMANFLSMMMGGGYPGAYGWPGGLPYNSWPYSMPGLESSPMMQYPGFGSWPMTQSPAFGAMPGLSPFGQSFGAPSTGLEQFFNQSQPSLNNNQSTTQGPSSPGNFWLNGQWQAQTGEMLQISGKNFRLVSRQGALTGFATSNGDLLNLYVPQMNQTLLFQVQLQGNAMMLRESGGMVLNFLKTGN